jgi:hypothetical protein
MKHMRARERQLAPCALEQEIPGGILKKIDFCGGVTGSEPGHEPAMAHTVLSYIGEEFTDLKQQL